MLYFDSIVAFYHKEGEMSKIKEMFSKITGGQIFYFILLITGIISICYLAISVLPPQNSADGYGELSLSISQIIALIIIFGVWPTIDLLLLSFKKITVPTNSKMADDTPDLIKVTFKMTTGQIIFLIIFIVGLIGIHYWTMIFENCAVIGSVLVVAYFLSSILAKFLGVCKKIYRPLNATSVMFLVWAIIAIGGK